MTHIIKFFSLQKTELEYEVSIRGETPASTVAELRKQINKLSQLHPSEDILCSHIEPEEDLDTCLELLDKINTTLTDDVSDKNTLGRQENLLNHLYHRLNRIEPSKEDLNNHIQCNVMFKELYEKLINLKSNSKDPLSVAFPNSEPSSSLTPVNVSVTCEGSSRIASDLGKIKFNGKSCVRSFIQRVTEFSVARNITGAKLLAYATEIFVDDALHWYRSVKEQVQTWDELTIILKQDFDRSDYDYRLLSEIRARTQGKSENITIYLAILAGMCSRLSRPLSEEDKLEIIMHNIRPCYASTLASAASISSINQLRALCRNYENVQSRLSQFREPLAATSDTLAPEYAYRQDVNTNSKNNYLNPKFGKNYNTNRQFPKLNPTNTNNFYNKPNTKLQYSNNYSPSTETNYVHAINKSDKRPQYCIRCRTGEHNTRQCPADRSEIFCFVCGHKNVKSPECPECAKNNQSPTKN